MSRLYEIINKMADNMGALIVTTSETKTQTVGASTGAWYEIQVSKEGYTPIGICGMRISGESSGRSDVRQYEITGAAVGTGIVRVYVWNTHTSSVTLTLTVPVLWLKA